MARPKKENPEILVSFTARFPQGLHEELKKIAKEQDRSLIGQVLFILKKYVTEYRELK